MTTTQRDLQQQLVSDYGANRSRIASIIRPLDPERLVRRPSPHDWSVAEALEHLVLTDELFLRSVEPLLRSARPDAGAPARSWSPTFVGRNIAGALERPRKLKSARRARPIKTRGGIAEAFLAIDARYTQLLSEVGTLDWNSVRFRPPVMPWLPLKMNLGDAFHIRRVHVKRHLGQIERIIASTA